MRSKHLRRVIQESLSPAYSVEPMEHEQQQQEQQHHHHHHEMLRRTPSELEDTASNAKRQRPSPTDTEDELLVAAGDPVKRVRGD